MRDNDSADEPSPTDRVSVVRGSAADLAEVVAIAGASADAPDWPLPVWERIVRREYEGAEETILLLAVDGRRRIGGWLVANRVSERSELEFVFVQPGQRGRGMGLLLAEDWLRWARDRGAQDASLEVRASNTAALRLYRKLGFCEQGRRKRYYREPAEDALLMGLKLDG